MMEKIPIYSTQYNIQGLRAFGYKAPTVFYFEVIPEENGNSKLLLNAQLLKGSMKV